MNMFKLVGFRHDDEDLSEFFQRNCVVQQESLNHFPFVVFVKKDYEIEIRVVKELQALKSLPDDTQVIKQWPGKWRSDYFHFTLGQLREWEKANPRDTKAYPKGEWQF